MSTTIVGRDHVGQVAGHGGMRFYVTDCGQASAKGSAGSPTGVCCRACYAPVDVALGGIPEQPPGHLSVEQVADREARDARRRLDEVTAALERVGQWLHPDATVVDELGPGLYVVANPAPVEGGTQCARHLLVLDEYRLTRASSATGTAHRQVIGPAAVHVRRGRGVTRDGFRTAQVSAPHRRLCEQLAEELLPR